MARSGTCDEERIPAPDPPMSSPVAPGPVNAAQPGWVSVVVSIVVACSLSALLLSSLL